MDSRQIEDCGRAWLAKRDSGQCTEAEEAEFNRWLRADVRHRVAYLRLEAAWERAARLKVFGVGRAAGEVPRPGEWRASPFFEQRPASRLSSVLSKRVPRIAVSAACVVLSAVAVFWFMSYRANDSYMTPVGGVASIPLKDGSSITLNTGSKLRVALTETERRIELQAGEAFFEVARDPARPFVVDAGDRRIVAVGTAFSVRREGADVQIVVTHGSVRVEPRRAGTNAELLAAGSVMYSARESQLVQKKTVTETESALSWRSGYLTFDETSLADAVAEFNRYNTERIVIEDPRIAALKITGKFRSTNAGDFVKLLHNGFGIQVMKSGDTVALLAQ